MSAPMANITKDAVAASQADGFSAGFTPISRTRWTLIAWSSSRWISSVAASRGFLGQADVDEHADQFGPLGFRAGA